MPTIKTVFPHVKRNGAGPILCIPYYWFPTQCLSAQLLSEDSFQFLLHRKEDISMPTNAAVMFDFQDIDCMYNSFSFRQDPVKTL